MNREQQLQELTEAYCAGDFVRIDAIEAQLNPKLTPQEAREMLTKISSDDFLPDEEAGNRLHKRNEAN